MDIVLSLCDTLVFDRVYAAVMPLNTITSAPDAFAYKAHETATTNLSRVSTGIEGGAFKSAVQLDQLIGLTPGRYAELSYLSREDPLRQLISLFFITW